MRWFSVLTFIFFLCVETQGLAATRILLSMATTFYVDRTHGTDKSGCGLASGASACQSVQYLVNALIANYDFGGNNITIQLANSADAYAAFQVSGPWIGAAAVIGPNGNVVNSKVVIAGNSVSPSSVVIDGNGSGYCVQANEYSSFTIRGVQVQNCALGLSAPEQHAELYFDHVTWASMPPGSVGIYASRQGYVEATGGGNTINSIGAYFLQATHQGNFRATELQTGPIAFTIANGLSCTNGDFAYMSSGGDITFTQYSTSAFSFIGKSPSCVQWGADSNGILQVINASTGKSMAPDFFPGTAAGSCVGDCMIDQATHTGPTVESCGKSPSILGGSTDYYGHVAEGANATGCIIKFNSSFAGTPYCLISWAAAAPASLTVTKSATALTLSHSSTSDATFDYFCKGF
jgi:hypothetical protein